MPVETFPFDSARYLDSEEAIEAYLEGVFEDGDQAVIAHALDVVARARLIRAAKGGGDREGSRS